MGDRALVIFHREGSNVRGQTEFQVNLKLGLTPCPPGGRQPPSSNHTG